MYSTSPPLSSDLKSIRVDKTFVRPGELVNFYLTNFVDSGPFYYTITGRISPSDFIDNVTTGTVLLTSGKLGVGYSTISKTIAHGINVAGNFFSIEIRRDSITGPVLLTSPVVFITEHQTPQPFAVVTPSTYISRPGETIIFYVDVIDSVGQGIESIEIIDTGRRYSPSTTITLSPPHIDTGVNATADISINPLNGSITNVSITNSGSGYLSPPFVTLSPETTGKPAVFKIKIPNTGMTNGTYNWSTVGSVSSSDFVDNVLSGTFVVTNNVGVITRTLSTNSSVEPGEVFSIEISKDSSNKTYLGKSSNILVTGLLESTTTSTSTATNTDYSHILEKISNNLVSISNSLNSLVNLANSTGIRTESPFDWTRPTEVYQWYNQDRSALALSTTTVNTVKTEVSDIINNFPKFL